MASPKELITRREFIKKAAAAAGAVIISPEVVLAAWPETPEQATAQFGGTPDRWEKNPNGGWHLKEKGFLTVINPGSWIGEGYFDTKPGQDAYAFAFAGVEVPIQGGTIWQESGPEAADRLREKMTIPRWSDEKDHPPVLILPRFQEVN